MHSCRTLSCKEGKAPKTYEGTGGLMYFGWATRGKTREMNLKIGCEGWVEPDFPVPQGPWEQRRAGAKASGVWNRPDSVSEQFRQIRGRRMRQERIARVKKGELSCDSKLSAREGSTPKTQAKQRGTGTIRVPWVAQGLAPVFHRGLQKYSECVNAPFEAKTKIQERHQDPDSLPSLLL